MSRPATRAEEIVEELFLTPEGRSDPYPRYHRLRETAPVHYSPQFDAWFVDHARSRERGALHLVYNFHDEAGRGSWPYPMLSAKAVPGSGSAVSQVFRANCRTAALRSPELRSHCGRSSSCCRPVRSCRSARSSDWAAEDHCASLVARCPAGAAKATATARFPSCPHWYQVMVWAIAASPRSARWPQTQGSPRRGYGRKFVCDRPAGEVAGSPQSVEPVLALPVPAKS